MKHARDLMQAAFTVSPSEPVTSLAAQLVDHGVDGACVVEGGALIGVVTSMDLIYREKAVHLPTFFVFFDAVIPFGQKRAEDEMKRIAAVDIRHIMTPKPTTVAPSATTETIATLMVEGNLSMIPVVDGGALVGVVTRDGLLRSMAARP